MIITLMGSVMGQSYYVSSTTGSNRNDGSKEAPFKNLQKALDVAESGATIHVAEGNYYGLLNKGNIIITKPVSSKAPAAPPPRCMPTATRGRRPSPSSVPSRTAEHKTSRIETFFYQELEN